jgi:hypothetical protein
MMTADVEVIVISLPVVAVFPKRKTLTFAGRGVQEVERTAMLTTTLNRRKYNLFIYGVKGWRASTSSQPGNG